MAIENRTKGRFGNTPTQDVRVSNGFDLVCVADGLTLSALHPRHMFSSNDRVGQTHPAHWLTEQASFGTWRPDRHDNQPTIRSC